MDKIESIDLLLKGKNNKNKFNRYDSSYLFTTENIKAYMPTLTGKSVLSVASSGDHYFNSILLGAEKIDLFDVNYLTKYVIRLKEVAIKELPYDVFCAYFGIFFNTSILDYNVYRLFREKLDDETRAYFDKLYQYVSYKGRVLFYRTAIFRSEFSNYVMIHMLNNYLSDEKHYNELKERLKSGIDYRFINTNIVHLASLISSEYDYMFFSNIQDYVRYETYVYSILSLRSMGLRDDGLMYVAYMYSDDEYEKNKMYMDLSREDGYSLESFNGYYGCMNNNDDKDSVLILRK